MKPLTRSTAIIAVGGARAGGFDWRTITVRTRCRVQENRGDFAPSTTSSDPERRVSDTAILPPRYTSSMGYRTQRRVSGVIGLALLLFVAGVLFVAGPPHSLVVSIQLTALALAGTCDTISAVDTQLTDRIPWHKWSGAGSILLGVSLPLGLVPTGGWGTDDLGMFMLMLLAGVTIAAIGLEMLFFDGGHIFDSPQSDASSSGP
jgi:hypothetical protein